MRPPALRVVFFAYSCLLFLSLSPSVFAQTIAVQGQQALWSHERLYFSPTSVTCAHSSTPTVVTLSMASKGTYKLTINGASRSFVHSTEATMTVTK